MAERGIQEDQQEQLNPSWQGYLILVTIALILIITAVIFYPDARQKMLASPTQAAQINPAPGDLIPDTPTLTAQFTESVPTISTPTPEVFAQTSQFGSLVLSIREGNDAHLFLYRPFLEKTSQSSLSALPLTRITTGHQQDISPAISPDGTRIAFGSNRAGPWDLYILDLNTGQTTRFTDTAAYEGNPTWSPDGKWLAYESYQLNNLDIFIQDFDRTSGPIPLTNHPAADYGPNWSGQGRKISFVSTRNGKQEIWYADLDSPRDDKAVLVPGPESLSVDHPAWSSDGRYLTWGVISFDGNHALVTWDSTHPEELPVYAGPGDWPIWGGAGEILFTLIKTPFESYLSAYPGMQEDLQVMLPALKLPGSVEGISWAKVITLNSSLESAQEPPPTALWEATSRNEAELSGKQENLVELRNLNAPYPRFVGSALSSFSPLRLKVQEEAGWDFLSTLEYAYIPLDETHEPGINLNWLYTGRGLMINDIPRLAGWLIVAREEYGEQTFWRVYLRANNQQGLQGKPVKTYPWDFETRYSRDNAAYENGGSRASIIPSGYWVDFTELAAEFGWSRFPAETFWQFSETASRYQYYAFTQGLSLESALLQLYSPGDIQALIGFPDP
jgi:TolB protein